MSPDASGGPASAEGGGLGEAASNGRRERGDHHDSNLSFICFCLLKSWLFLLGSLAFFPRIKQMEVSCKWIPTLFMFVLEKVPL